MGAFALDAFHSFREWHIEKCYLNKDQWDAMKPLPVTLDWKQVPFDINLDLNDIPDQPGIYSFSIVAGNAGLPPNGYIAYVGVAGEKGPKPDGGKSGRHLRQRYKEYIREKKTVVRAHVHRLLNQWDGSLVFHYAVVPQYEKLREIESTLLNTLIPPVNKRDFDVVIAQNKGAAW